MENLRALRFLNEHRNVQVLNWTDKTATVRSWYMDHAGKSGSEIETVPLTMKAVRALLGY